MKLINCNNYFESDFNDFKYIIINDLKIRVETLKRY